MSFKNDWSKYFFVLVLSSLNIFGSIQAQTPYQWRETNGQLSQEIVALAADKAGNIFAAMNSILRSSDNGLTWDRVFAVEDFRYNSILCTQSGDIYIGIGIDTFSSRESRGIYKSSDSGSTWTQVYDKTNITAIAENKAGHIFAAGELTNAQITRSMDGGQTWEEFGLNSRYLKVTSIVVNDKGEIYASTGTTLSSETPYPGVLRSQDNGNTWEQMSSGIDQENAKEISELSINRNGYLFAISRKHVYRYNDIGEFWTKTNLALFEESNPYDVDHGSALATNDRGDVYVGTWGEASSSYGFPGNVYISKDDGQSWVKTRAGLPEESGFRVTEILIDRQENVFLGSNRGLIRKTTNDSSWTLINTGLFFTQTYDVAVDKNDNVWVANGIGLYSSNDYGKTWVKNLDGNFSAIGVAQNGYIYAGSVSSSGAGGKLLFSSDGGKTWTFRGLNDPYGASGIAFNKKGDVFVTTWQSGVFRSSNNGESWQEANSNTVHLRI